MSHSQGPDVDASVDAPGPDAAIAIDAGPAARCDPHKDFAMAKPITSVNSPRRDQAASLLDDDTLIFASNRASDTQAGLYTATRSAPTAAFGAPQPVTAVNAMGDVSGPSVTADGLTLYYTLTTTAGGVADGDIYVTHRANRNAAFMAGNRVNNIYSSSTELDPFIAANGSLYFESARGGTTLHLWYALPAGAEFAAPQPVAELNSTTAGVVDSHPVLSRDGLTIYWSSTRNTKGDTDIWWATRPTTAAAFGALTALTGSNTAMNEAPSWISPDGCELYFQSDRAGGMGAQDIYVAIKPL